MRLAKWLGGCGLLAACVWMMPGAALAAKSQAGPRASGEHAGNPVIDGWYADPEGAIFGKTYWIYPTYSAKYGQQTFFDAFSSKDLVHWTKHAKVLSSKNVSWAHRAMWAPAITEKDGKYYFFFAANDIHHDSDVGGIGVAVSDHPGGPFHDLIGKPLVGAFHHGAQPIDPAVFKDSDGTYYLLYGGWGHLNIARLSDDFKSIVPLPDGQKFKEITPKDYVEGPLMFKRDGKYYLMWSEGGWTGPDYSVAYAVADSPLGPFKRVGKILKQNAKVATGAGHNGIIHVKQGDRWYIVYHRRPLGQTDANHRVVCIDRLYFDRNGHIKPVTITFKGVKAHRVP
ncbi:glycoside hydrolase family 43 protein [Oleiagrimonas sp. C23AA]|uniref:glycoside hydrolase family 43 protein n=1 Tax=Oleiagrimonas sp. C23AA TaxID=2719047 RepID=UPI00141E774D|nr:glycoside hydrolase family 43 protein [Oleiagrimonas sp. C23AA]NII09585.1 family 43 glycosylhydrolase [Oleiagrimonas sp. C23AA]